MLNSEKRMRYKLYTQTKNSCAIDTCFNIIRAKYGIIFTDEDRNRCKEDADKAGIWSENGGAIFRFFYNWFTGWIYKEIGLELNVVSYDLLGQDFEKAFNEGEGFGIGMMYAGSWYREVREDGEITLQEIQDTKKEDYNFYGHNFFWKKEYIVAILRSIHYKDKFIKFKKQALQEGIRKGLFRQTARSFKASDGLLDYYLTELNKGSRFAEIETMEENHRKALEKAIKLRTF